MATSQKLNTGGSVVDYIKSTGGDASFSSRTKLAEQYGIKGYTGSAAQNTQLLQALQKPAAGAPSSSGGNKNPLTVKDQVGAASYINGGQQDDFDAASSANEPPIRGSSRTYEQIFADLQKSITGGTKKPQTFNFEEQYRKELSSQGITPLEDRMTELDAEEQQLRAEFRTNKAAEFGKPVAMNVIEGRVSEQERAANERLDVVLREKDYVTNQLNTKYNVVNNVMKFRQMDYEQATEAYNTQFTQNLQLFSTVKGIADAEKSDLERKEDIARANTQIIYNSITSGGLKIDDITPDQQLQITKLETQSGLPVGFYKTLQNKNPKADIVTSTTREVGGKKYVDVIMRNEDGSLSTNSMYVGGVDLPKSGGGSSEKMSEAERLRYDAGRVAQQLSSKVGQDGRVSGSDYDTARKAWVSAGYLGKDFDERFEDFVPGDRL